MWITLFCSVTVLKLQVYWMNFCKVALLRDSNLFLLDFQALSTESVEKLPVFNKSASKHYQTTSEADDWCVPSKGPKNMAKQSAALWREVGIETPQGIKLASRAAFGSIHLPSNKQVSGLAEEKEDKSIINLVCMHWIWNLAVDFRMRKIGAHMSLKKSYV